MNEREKEISELNKVKTFIGFKVGVTVAILIAIFCLKTFNLFVS